MESEAPLNSAQAGVQLDHAVSAIAVVEQEHAVSAQAGVKDMLHIYDYAAWSPWYKHKAEWGKRFCAICNQRLFPIVADKSGTMHQNCSTLKNGKIFNCGMCGLPILHTGNEKVHVNCRTLRASMGEGEAKRYLH